MNCKDQAYNTNILYRRPGILVLINNVDWELEDEKNCELKTGDNVHFISTLHGG